MKKQSIEQKLADRLITKNLVNDLVQYAIEPIFDWGNEDGKVSDAMAAEAYGKITPKTLTAAILASKKFQELLPKIASELSGFYCQEVEDIGYCLEDDKEYATMKVLHKELKTKIAKALPRDQYTALKKAVQDGMSL